jgi:membrane-bound lytic murein transglycosylase D
LRSGQQNKVDRQRRRDTVRSEGWSMKRIFQSVILALAGLALAGPTRAQDDALSPELLQQAAELLADNLDDDALDALGVDKERAHQFLAELQKRLQDSQVYDLATLRTAAVQLQPLLASFEETQPYAVWLKAHLDYFEVSERLRSEASGKTNSVTPLLAPSPETQRRMWTKVIEERPAPVTTNKQVARLKQIFIEEKVPPQLVWLAEVESSFDARARSPAGAAGLFQLMPATARSLDLSVNLLRDDRLNAEKNARAAARYLRYLHGRFKDWRLALAAYNCGEGRVAGLLKKHRGKTYDDINQFLPTETQMYVPKFEATLRKHEKLAMRDLPLPKA